MPPLTVMIKPVSGACNMNCDYCFYTDVMNRREVAVHPRMSLTVLERIVKSAFRYADDHISFAFQGGEPTLAGLPFYEALIKFEKKYNSRNIRISNSLQTNGYDISDEMIDFFAREHFLLGVSLDGDASLHDQMRKDRAGLPTFERIQKNLSRLQDAGVAFNVLCVVNDEVAKEPERVLHTLSPYGYLQFIYCLDELDGTPVPHSLTEENYLHFLKTAFDLYEKAYDTDHPISIRNFDNYIGILLGFPPESCAMRGQCSPYYLVESDGSVYPCDFYVLDEWNMGNIQDTSFLRLANSPVGHHFREESLPVPDQCRSCKWYGLCRNGCKRERDPQTGLNRWCKCFSSFFEYSFERMTRLARKASKIKNS